MHPDGTFPAGLSLSATVGMLKTVVRLSPDIFIESAFRFNETESILPFYIIITLSVTRQPEF